MATEKHNYIIRLTAEGGDVVSASMKKVGSDGEKSLKVVEQAANNTDLRMKILASTLYSRLIPAIGATATVRSIFSNIQDFERLDTRIRTLTDAAGDYGATQQYLKETADQLAVGVATLTDNYARLRTLQNAGLIDEGQVKALSTGLINAAAALGASETQIGQVMYGLSQGLSAGTLRAEEFNQVTEPLPGLMQALDKAAGVAAGGFRKMVNAGEVTSKMFAEVLIKALQEFEGAAEKMADTSVGAITRLNNAWVNLSRAIGDTGIIGLFADSTQMLAAFTSEMTKAAGPQQTFLESIRNLALGMNEYNGALAQRRKLEADIKAVQAPKEFQTVSGAQLSKMATLGQPSFDQYLHGTKWITGQLKEAEAAFSAPKATSSTTRSSASDNAAEQADRRAEAIRSVAESIQFETEQLSRSNNEQEIYNELRRAGVARDSDAGQQIEALVSARQKEEASIRASEDALRSQAEQLERNRFAAQAMGYAFSDSFQTLIEEGGDALDFLENLFGNVLDSLIGNFSNQIGQSLAMAAAGSMGGGGTGSFIGSMFGGYRATGGPIQPGKWYIAGEEGPEAVWGGGSGSFVVPHGGAVMAAQQQAPVNVTVINNTSSQVSTSTKSGPNGRELRVMVDEAVANAINSPSSKINSALTRRESRTITRR